MSANEPVKIFISYSHADEQWGERVRAALEELPNAKDALIFFDRELMPGDNWESRIRDEIASSNAVVLLVSPEFLNSDYCYGKELQTAFDRSACGQAAVIPIILRDCKWMHSPLADFRVLPSKHDCLADRGDYSQALRSIAREVIRYATETKEHSGTPEK